MHFSNALQRYKCFFRVSDVSGGIHQWMVDLEVDPRHMNTVALKKRDLKDREEFAAAIKQLADPEISSLDILETECKAHLAYYVKQDERLISTRPCMSAYRY